MTWSVVSIAAFTPTVPVDICGGSVCLDRFFGFLSGKIVLVVVVAVGM
jgi:hypothetical protein